MKDHNLSEFKCEHCLARFKLRITHKKHQELCALKAYGCPLCEMRFRTKRGLNCHRRKVHRKPKHVTIDEFLETYFANCS